MVVFFNMQQGLCGVAAAGAAEAFFPEPFGNLSRPGDISKINPAKPLLS